MNGLKSPVISSLVILLLLLLALCARSLPPAHLGQVGHRPPQKPIDWTHPVELATSLHPSQSDGAGARSPQVMHTPQANSPTNCYQNTAYYIKVLGQTSWSQTYQNYRTTVWYLWCPRWAGDSVGQNWAFGRAYVLSGCSDVQVGAGGAFGWDGARIVPPVVNDGESSTVYDHICNGASVWDDSLTVDGSGKYMVTMMAEFLTAGLTLAASSPCCY
jgi:hypothetical protein